MVRWGKWGCFMGEPSGAAVIAYLNPSFTEWWAVAAGGSHEGSAGDSGVGPAEALAEGTSRLLAHAVDSEDELLDAWEAAAPLPPVDERVERLNAECRLASFDTYVAPSSLLLLQASSEQGPVGPSTLTTPLARQAHTPRSPLYISLTCSLRIVSVPHRQPLYLHRAGKPCQPSSQLEEALAALASPPGVQLVHPTSPFQPEHYHPLSSVHLRSCHSRLLDVSLGRHRPLLQTPTCSCRWSWVAPAPPLPDHPSPLSPLSALPLAPFPSTTSFLSPLLLPLPGAEAPLGS